MDMGSGVTRGQVNYFESKYDLSYVTSRGFVVDAVAYFISGPVDLLKAVALALSGWAATSGPSGRTH